MQSMNHQWRLVSRPRGRLDKSNFEWTAEPIPQPAEGQILLRTILLSLDPANRGWTSSASSYRASVPLNTVMQGLTISQVIMSRNTDYRVGDIVESFVGWQEYGLSNGRGLRRLPTDYPLHVHFGPLGMVGLTAYFGLHRIGKPRPGETLVVSAAAGAVGSLVGQLGASSGCRVVGIAGTDEKCAWITQELGFDAAINYRRHDVARALKNECPEGIDIYFDNVGGEISDQVLGQMNRFGRIPLCGLISTYNATEPVPGPSNYARILTQRLRVQGFIVTDFVAHYNEALAELTRLWNEGTLQYRTHIIEGLEQAVTALNMLFDGQNQGKLIIELSEPSEI